MAESPRQSNSLDDDAKENKEGKINIIVKTIEEKKNLEVHPDMTVEELKQIVAKLFNADVELLCLIFAGRILHDNDVLSARNVKEGHTIYLVIKSTPRTSGVASTNENTSLPYGLGNIGGLAGLRSMGMGQQSYADLQNQMQRQVHNNPNMMQSLMNNPLVQQLIDNPETMRNLMSSVPEVQALCEQYPEFNRMLNDPRILRQCMDLMRNPAMYQEFTRNTDRALINLENIPGGMQALERMHQQIQETMESTRADRNPFAVSGTGNADGSNPQQGTVNREPLPNPWLQNNQRQEGRNQQANQKILQENVRNQQANQQRNQVNLQQNQQGKQQQNQQGTQQQGNQSQQNEQENQPQQQHGINTQGIFENNEMRNLLGQMYSNPDLIRNMLNAPYTRNILETMAQNPDLTNSLLNESPWFGGSANIAEHMRTAMPMILEQLRNPEFQTVVSDPNVLNAFFQIQEGNSNY